MPSLLKRAKTLVQSSSNRNQGVEASYQFYGRLAESVIQDDDMSERDRSVPQLRYVERCERCGGRCKGHRLRSRSYSVGSRQQRDRSPLSDDDRASRGSRGRSRRADSPPPKFLDEDTDMRPSRSKSVGSSSSRRRGPSPSRSEGGLRRASTFDQASRGSARSGNGRNYAASDPTFQPSRAPKVEPTVDDYYNNSDDEWQENPVSNRVRGKSPHPRSLARGGPAPRAPSPRPAENRYFLRIDEGSETSSSDDDFPVPDPVRQLQRRSSMGVMKKGPTGTRIRFSNIVGEKYPSDHDDFLGDFSDESSDDDVPRASRRERGKKPTMTIHRTNQPSKGVFKKVHEFAYRSPHSRIAVQATWNGTSFVLESSVSTVQIEDRLLKLEELRSVVNNLLSGLRESWRWNRSIADLALAQIMPSKCEYMFNSPGGITEGHVLNETCQKAFKKVIDRLSFAERSQPQRKLATELFKIIFKFVFDIDISHVDEDDKLEAAYAQMSQVYIMQYLVRRFISVPSLIEFSRQLVNLRLPVKVIRPELSLETKNDEDPSDRGLRPNAKGETDDALTPRNSEIFPRPFDLAERDFVEYFINSSTQAQYLTDWLGANQPFDNAMQEVPLLMEHILMRNKMIDRARNIQMKACNSYIIYLDKVEEIYRQALETQRQNVRPRSRSRARSEVDRRSRSTTRGATSRSEAGDAAPKPRAVSRPPVVVQARPKRPASESGFPDPSVRSVGSSLSEMEDFVPRGRNRNSRVLNGTAESTNPVAATPPRSRSTVSVQSHRDRSPSRFSESNKHWSNAQDDRISVKSYASDRSARKPRDEHQANLNNISDRDLYDQAKTPRSAPSLNRRSSVSYSGNGQQPASRNDYILDDGNQTTRSSGRGRSRGR